MFFYLRSKDIVSYREHRQGKFNSEVRSELPDKLFSKERARIALSIFIIGRNSRSSRNNFSIPQIIFLVICRYLFVKQRVFTPRFFDRTHFVSGCYKQVTFLNQSALNISNIFANVNGMRQSSLRKNIRNFLNAAV